MGDDVTHTGSDDVAADSGGWVVDTTVDTWTDTATAVRAFECDSEHGFLLRQPSGMVLPFGDLRAAVAVADAGALVLVCSGVHRTNVTVDRDLTILAPAGGSGGEPSVLLPDDHGAVFTVSGGQTVRLVGLHVRGCDDAPDGRDSGGPDSGTDSGSDPNSPCNAVSTGIVVAEAASASLTNVRLSHHSAGGLWAGRGATVELVGGRVDHNRADEGGGLYVAGSTVVAGTEVSDNDAVRGGGWYVDAGDLFGSDIVIRGNHATHGGGLFARGSMVWLDGSEVGSNGAELGGGAFLWGGNTLGGADAVVTANTARLGGGVYVDGTGQPVDVFARIDDNTASEDGGGAYLTSGTVTASAFTRNRALGGEGGAAFVGPWATLEVQQGDLGRAGPDDNVPPDVYPSAAGVNMRFGVDACFWCDSETCTPCD